MIKKAVIPVAGLGTRMLPATKAIPKEMLPIVDKPLIQYVVKECINANITEIVLVTHGSKNSIENHFDTSFELEATLEKRVKRQLLDEVKGICPNNVTIMHVRQGAAKGLGHAILTARPIIGDAPFAVVLPDVIIDCSKSNIATDNLSKMVNMFKDTGCSQIMVEPVADNLVDQFGIVDIKGQDLKPGQAAPISGIIEKPAVGKAPSNLSVTGRYILSSEIWALLEKTTPGAGDEIQLTDAIAALMKKSQVNAFYMQGKVHDCGSKLGYMKANVDYALRHKQLGAEFQEYILETAKQINNSNIKNKF